MKSYSSIWIHVIWTTKNRIPVLKKDLRISLCKYIKQHDIQNEYIVDTVNGVEDHIHCLIRLRPVQRLSDIVKKIKGSSSNWINKQSKSDIDFSWQRGYAAISVNPQNLKNIREYIKRQEAHHQSMKLEKEFQRFENYSSI